MSLASLAITFANNLLPILLISAGGFFLGRATQIDPRPIGRVVFYLLSPALVFNLLLNNRLPLGEAGLTLLLAALVVAGMGSITLALSRLLRFDRRTTIAAMLAAMFANTGNYGLPLIAFAFGDATLAHASLYFVATSILFNSVGVLIASLGHLDLRAALLGLLKVPVLYAVIIALSLSQAHISLPLPLERVLSQLASGAIPVMIILLGLELSKVKWSGNLRNIGVVAGIRLLAGPLVGFGLAAAFGLPDPARQSLIIDAAMPSAVNNTVLANEYKLDTSFITAVIFIGTVLSPLTLTPLLVFLGN